MTTSAEYEQQFPVSPDAQRRSDHRDSILRHQRLRRRPSQNGICLFSETPAYRAPPGWQKRDKESAGSLSLSSSVLFPKSACQGDGTVIRIHLRPLFVLSAWSDGGSLRERFPGTDFMPSRSLYVPGISSLTQAVSFLCPAWLQTTGGTSARSKPPGKGHARPD